MIQVINIIFPVFALIAAGYACRKFGLLNDVASVEINRFVVWLALPAQLFDFTSRHSIQLSSNGGFILAFGGSALAIFFIVLSIQWYRYRHWAQASFDGLSASYANTGYMGIPLCILALGESSLGLAIISTLIVVCGLFSLAIIFVEAGLNAHHRWHEILRTIVKSIFTNPLLIAPVLGALLASQEIIVYAPIRTFLSLLAGAASPCALVSIGLFLAKKSTLPSKGIGLVIFMKLIIQPLIAWIIAAPLLHLSPTVIHTAVLLSALPTGTGPLMLAQYYQTDGAFISKVVLLTTLGSLGSLSLILWWLI